jgi:hypothetical protein
MPANTAGQCAGQFHASGRHRGGERQAEFDRVQSLLQPYVTAGTTALGQQQALADRLERRRPAAGRDRPAADDARPSVGS